MASLDELRDKLHGMQEDLRKSSDATARMADSFKSMSVLDIFKKVGTYGLAATTIFPELAISKGLRKYVEIFKSGKVDVEEFSKKVKASVDITEKAYAALGGPISQQGRVGRFTKPGSFLEHLAGLKDEKEISKAIGKLKENEARQVARTYVDALGVQAVAKERFEIAKKEQEIFDRIQKTGSRWLIGSVFWLTKETVQVAREFNTALIETNSLLGARGDIVSEALKSQILTGVSIHENAEMLRALTHQAFKTREEFRTVLTTALELKDGFGLGAEQVARLVRTAEMLHMPFQQVADIMATIVDNTRLTASEAESLFETLRAGYLIIGSATRETYENIAKLEGILKARTGHPDEIRRLIASMTTTVPGAARAQIFGVRPEELRTDVGVRQLEQSMARFVEQTTRGKQGLGLIQALTNISEQLTGGVMSPESLLKLSESIRESNKEQIIRISGEERWKQQMVDTTKALDRLKGMFQAFIMGGLNPAVKFLQWISNIGSWFIGVLGKWTPLLKTFQVTLSLAFGVATVVATYKLWMLIGAIRELGRIALINAGKVALGSAATAGVATAGGIVGGGVAGSRLITSIRGFFPMIWPWITGTVIPALVHFALPIVLAGAGGYLLGAAGVWLWNKITGKAKADQLSLEQKIRTAGEREVTRAQYFQSFQAERMAAMKAGSVEMMKRAYEHWQIPMHTLSHGAVNPRNPITMAWLRQERLEGMRDVLTYEMTKAQLTSSDRQNAANIAKQVELQEQHLTVLERQHRQQVEDSRDTRHRWAERQWARDEQMLQEAGTWGYLLSFPFLPENDPRMNPAFR